MVCSRGPLLVPLSFVCPCLFVCADSVGVRIRYTPFVVFLGYEYSDGEDRMVSGK